ncbi:MAG: hypothetical protein D6696_05485 [Acidobacteria bacterium]|nr:MAG: hypothetical protein D6696_05485 [Acidobacteriota bacterium]
MKLSADRMAVAGALLAALVAVPALAEDADSDPPQRVEVGQQAPPVELKGCDDQDYDLASLRGQKNAVLVFFRGSW